MADVVQDVLVRFQSDVTSLTKGLGTAGRATDDLKAKNRSLFQSYKDFSAVGRDIFGAINKAVDIGKQGLKAYEDQLKKTGGSASELARIKKINDDMSESWNNLLASVGKVVVELGPALSIVGELLNEAAKVVLVIADGVGEVARVIEKIRNFEIGDAAKDLASFVGKGAFVGLAFRKFSGEESESSFRDFLDQQANTVRRQVDLIQAVKLVTDNAKKVQDAIDKSVAQAKGGRKGRGSALTGADLIRILESETGPALEPGFQGIPLGPDTLPDADAGALSRFAGGTSGFQPIDTDGLKASADAMQPIIENLGLMREASMSFATSFSDAFVQAAASSESFGVAFKKAFGQILLGQSYQLLGTAVQETALGFASLALGPIGGISAAGHFKAAATAAAGAVIVRGFAGILGAGGGGASSGGGASASATSGGGATAGLGGGGGGGGGSRTINVILTGGFGEEPPRVRRARLLRAIHEAESETVVTDAVRNG